MISGRAKLAGIMGDPVGHSLSPLIHAHWLDVYGIDGAYIPLAVAKSEFSTALEGLRVAGFGGFNVTVPHKEAAFAVADRQTPVALACRAANLLFFRGNLIQADNTDVEGLRTSLEQELGAGGLKGSTAIILGAGGAARAAVLALSQMGLSEIRVLARNAARAEGLARDVQSSASTKTIGLGWDAWRKAAPDTMLLVNATSGGMRGNTPLDLALDPLPKAAAVCDIVYSPLATPLLTAGRLRGHKTIDGLGMLMHQAAPAFDALFGVKPSVTPLLRTELEEALRERG